MSAPITQIQTNAAWDSCNTPRLSVLIPFYRDAPIDLLEAIAVTCPDGVEAILFDDGVPDVTLNADVSEAIAGLAIPAQLITSRINRGRSAARNRLASAARAPWLLFLDADMEISPEFLTRWITFTQTTRAGALFGGFEPSEPRRCTRVHAALAEQSDVHSARERDALGAVAICSSNLAVRADAFSQTPFDEGFEGWGWEDVDWALSASAHIEVSHVDNPARHDGLETVDGLLAKFSQSGPNFARLLSRHPDYAQRPGAKLASIVKAWRVAPLARMTGAFAARFAALPITIRVLGLKLYRAGVAAEAL